MNTLLSLPSGTYRYIISARPYDGRQPVSVLVWDKDSKTANIGGTVWPVTRLSKYMQILI